MLEVQYQLWTRKVRRVGSVVTMCNFMSEHGAQGTIAEILRYIGIVEHGSLHYATEHYNVQTMRIGLSNTPQQRRKIGDCK